jgi:hypothetical protein
LKALLSCTAGGARALPAVCAAALALAGCGPNDNDPGPGGVTVGEARALDEAAEMLDQQRFPEEAVRGETPAEDKTPEPEATSER